MKIKCLRAHPHVLKRIRALWGEPELEIYINSLLLTDQPREGFSPKAFKELTQIVEIHRLLYGKCEHEDQWSHDPCCARQ